MHLGYRNIRNHSDGRVFNDPLLEMKSPKEAVRIIVKSELLFGTSVEIIEVGQDIPYHKVILTTKVLGTVDTVHLRFYKDCIIAMMLFDLVGAYVNYDPVFVTATSLVRNVEAMAWIKQVPKRLGVLATWLLARGIVLPEGSKEDELLTSLELLLEGHTPADISHLLS